MKRRWAASLVACAALLVAQGGDAGAVSLQDELNRLLREHPQLRAGAERVAEADARVDEAFSQFYPTVEVSGDTGREDTNNRVRRRIQGESARYWRKSGELTVTQNVFSGFRRYADLDEARLRREAQDVELSTDRQSLLFDGVSAYLNVVRQQHLLAVALNTEQTIQEQMQLENERVERGSGIAVDVLLAKSRLQVAKERRVGIDGNLRTVMATYNQVFGDMPELGSMEDVVPPADEAPATLDEALQTATGNNPNLERVDLLIQAAAERKRSAEASYYPEVDVVGSGRFEDDFDGVSGLNKQYSILLRGRWELFNGFETRSRAAAAARERSALMNEANDIARKVEEQVRAAWEAVETGRERVSLLENAVRIASEVFEARQRLRTAGKETAINVLDAQTEVFNAQLSLIDADYDTRLAAYRLLLAMGRLVPGTLGLASAE